MAKRQLKNLTSFIKVKFVKRLILPVAIICMATGISFSQSYILSPNDTILVTGLMEDLETLTISQINTSLNTIFLKWQQVSEFVPQNWEVTICDNTNCNTSLVDSGMMNPVIPGDYGFLLMHITAHVNPGTAVVRYAVWDISNPILRDTLTFIMTVNVTSGINNTEKNKAVNIYPNPSTGSFSVITNQTEGFNYVIADISGKMIKTGTACSGYKTFTTENLKEGLYYFSVFQKNKLQSSKQFIINY